MSNRKKWRISSFLSSLSITSLFSGKRVEIGYWTLVKFLHDLELVAKNFARFELLCSRRKEPLYSRWIIQNWTTKILFLYFNSRIITASRFSLAALDPHAPALLLWTSIILLFFFVANKLRKKYKTDEEQKISFINACY